MFNWIIFGIALILKPISCLVIAFTVIRLCRNSLNITIATAKSTESQLDIFGIFTLKKR